MTQMPTLGYVLVPNRNACQEKGWDMSILDLSILNPPDVLFWGIMQ